MKATDKILELIAQSGKSDYAIKKEIGLKNSILSDLRSGRAKNPSLDTIVAFAQYFNVSADYLLCLTDEISPLNNKQAITKAVPAGRPEQSVALSNYEENCENLATDEHFVNTAHLYAQLNILMRSALYGSLVRWLEDHGVNVSQILGLN